MKNISEELFFNYFAESCVYTLMFSISTSLCLLLFIFTFIDIFPTSPEKTFHYSCNYNHMTNIKASKFFLFLLQFMLVFKYIQL